MIKLTFMINREILNFIVEKREVRYFDRIWKNPIRVLPKDERLVEQVLSSRNKIPAQILQMFNLSKEDLEEYEKAKEDWEIADIIVKDATSKGCRLIRRESDI